jgi:hippurate hydrolase
MTMRDLLLAAAAIALLPASPAAAQNANQNASGPGAIRAAVKADYDASLGALWDWFHRNPELSFREVNTAARMAKELRAVPGMTVTEKVGGTGVVGVLKNGDGPVVLLRADMDGLPVEEKSGLPNASKARQVGVDGVEAPVMHACGHDVHITAMVGTARQLAARRGEWRGTAIFIVQPAEERVGGAKAMIDDGLYTRFPKPDYALAFHVAAQLPTGTVSAAEGIQYSSSDSVNVTVHGVGAHGASPHQGKDPVYIGAQIVTALQGVISRDRPPLRPGVITVGAFHAGLKHNIISDRADLQITVRANDEETRAQLIAGIRRVAEGIGRANGLPEDKLPEVKVIEGTPTTINDAALARRLNARFRTALGDAAVVPFEQTGMGAEDFAYLVEAKHGVKGYYFAVGGTPPAAIAAEARGGAPVPSHHSPLFRIDPEPSVRLGAEAMTIAALDLLQPR